jgi:ATP-binding cassette subfamily B protein
MADPLSSGHLLAERDSTTRRRWLAPEVVQASPMDCGPSALHALATGFGVPVSYGRLREACQTDVDGTSIDALERVARELGLDALQVLVPADHVGHARAATLPAIAVTRIAGGSVHFVLVWRRVGRWLQVMDPGSGRRWIELETFRRSLYLHGVDLPAELWRRFAGSQSSTAVLRELLAGLGHSHARERVDEVLADPGWRALAALEAAARMARSLVAARALARGAEAERLIDALFARARDEAPAQHAAVPAVYWSVRPHPPAADGAQLLHVRGAVLLRALGLRTESAAAAAQKEGAPAASELALALAEPTPSVAGELWNALRGADLRVLLGLGLLTGAAALLVLVQALVFRALLELGPRLRLEGERLAVALLVVGFVLALALLELPLLAGFLRLGRHLEARLRVAFQERLPRLAQRWFGSRPSSDMAERAHGLFLLRQVPALAGRTVRALATLVFTAAGLCWLDPGSAALVLCATAAAVLVPLLFARLLAERELLVRSHHGALSRFYLEALVGLVAVRVHGAERALRREHEALLVEWARAGLKLARGALGLRVATSLAGAATAIALLAEHLAQSGTTPAALLFGYWALALPVLGEQLALVVLQAPSMRNAARRALEPLAAPYERETRENAAIPAREQPNLAPLAVVGRVELRAAGAVGSAPAPAVPAEKNTPLAMSGVALELRRVSLALGGHAVLRELDLALAPGEHVALVGRSGAGKSSLIALALGLQSPSTGELRADGRPLRGEALARLRSATAWIDPGVQLWNRSAFENLVYGVGATDELALARALEQTDLLELAGNLPRGLESPLGEGGSFLSGGEGQRMRLARAWLRSGVRLALLDEPFRGLDRRVRRKLLARARAHWSGATLLAVTHDIEDTLGFDRVVVLETGQLVEQGVPAALAADAGSHYARLLAAERELLARGWHAADWTRWRVEDGVVVSSRPAAGQPASARMDGGAR